MSGASYDVMAKECEVMKANIGSMAARLRKKGVDLPKRGSGKGRGPAITRDEIATLQGIVNEATEQAQHENGEEE